MESPLTKTEVLGRIWADHALLEALIAPLSAVQMVQPLADGWSVKDVLAHITVWEGLLVEWLTALTEGTFPSTPVPSSREAVDRLNAERYAAAAARPLPMVLTAFHRSFGRVLQAVDALPDGVDLALPLPQAWAARVPLGQWIAENTYAHFQEHMAANRAWREAARSSA
jgi:hypothetical protein